MLVVTRVPAPRLALLVEALRDTRPRIKPVVGVLVAVPAVPAMPDGSAVEVCVFEAWLLEARPVPGARLLALKASLNVALAATPAVTPAVAQAPTARLGVDSSLRPRRPLLARLGSLHRERMVTCCGRGVAPPAAVEAVVAGT